MLPSQIFTVAGSIITCLVLIGVVVAVVVQSVNNNDDNDNKTPIVSVTPSISIPPTPPQEQITFTMPVTYTSNTNIFPGAAQTVTYLDNQVFVSDPEVTILSATNILQGADADVKLSNITTSDFTGQVQSYDVITGAGPAPVQVTTIINDNNLYLTYTNVSQYNLMFSYQTTDTVMVHAGSSNMYGTGSWGTFAAGVSNTIYPAKPVFSQNAFYQCAKYVNNTPDTRIILAYQETANNAGFNRIYEEAGTDNGPISMVQTAAAYPVIIGGMPGNKVVCLTPDIPGSILFSPWTAHNTTAADSLALFANTIDNDLVAFGYSNSNGDIFFVSSTVAQPSELADWNSPVTVLTADSKFSNDSGRQLNLAKIKLGTEIRPIMFWSNHDIADGEYWITFTIASDITGSSWLNPSYRVGGTPAQNNQRVFQTVELPNDQVGVAWLGNFPNGNVFYTAVDGNNPAGSRRVLQLTEDTDIRSLGVSVINTQLGIVWADNSALPLGNTFIQVTQPGQYDFARDTDTVVNVTGYI